MTSLQLPALAFQGQYGLPLSETDEEGNAVRELIEQGALFVSNHSGGKDSQAMLIRLLEIVPPDQLVVVHASLGNMEWPGALELAREQAETGGLPFIVARASKTLLEMAQQRYTQRYAADILGLSTMQAYRLCKKYDIQFCGAPRKRAEEEWK